LLTVAKEEIRMMINFIEMKIEHTSDKKYFETGANIMCHSEPWITLKRNYHQCLQAFDGDYKEIYVAVENDDLLGFIILQMAGTFRGYIQTIAVAENARSKGIGSKLIEFAEKRIFTISPNIFICVSSFNEDAQKLYTKLGYEKIGVLKDFIIEGYDEILLRKTIGTLDDFISKK
jgi:[ribosomal protein S18]-alanine N-acetyltransferase